MVDITEILAHWYAGRYQYDVAGSQVTWPDFDKHCDYVVELLRAGVTKATIHQRLRDEHGVSGSVASFKRYVANLPDTYAAGDCVHTYHRLLDQRRRGAMPTPV